jgi:ubiquinone/menaquinone biosynthesis C-methylase UbiE
MMNLRFEDEVFDLVVHSDTLEHIPDPVRGLSQCRRVLRRGGYCAFTVPMIVDRLTMARHGLPPSYHGSSSNPADCLVHTEYGADAWKHVLLASFAECRIVSLEYPAAQALVGVRPL